jgi:hypothetical protein
MLDVFLRGCPQHSLKALLLLNPMYVLNCEQINCNRISEGLLYQQEHPESSMSAKEICQACSGGHFDLYFHSVWRTLGLEPLVEWIKVQEHNEFTPDHAVGTPTRLDVGQMDSRTLATESESDVWRSYIVSVFHLVSGSRLRLSLFVIVYTRRDIAKFR